LFVHNPSTNGDGITDALARMAYCGPHRAETVVRGTLMQRAGRRDFG